MLKVIDPRESRAYTVALLELVYEGEMDKNQLIFSLLNWMSEADVKEFCQRYLRDDNTNECFIGPKADDEKKGRK